MQTHSFLFSILTGLGICLLAGSAAAQQPADEKPAALPKTASESGPSVATASRAVAPSPFEDALALYRGRQFGEASLALEHLGQSGGADAAKAFAWLARAELKLGKIAEAEASAQKALALSPDLPTGHSALGEVYFREGKFADAEKEFLAPLKAGIPDPRSYLGEARLSWVSSNQIHSKKLIDKAHALDPQDPEIREWWLRTLPRAESIVSVAKDAHSGDAANPVPTLKPEPVSKDAPATAPAESNCGLVTHVTSTEAPLEGLMFSADLIRGFALNVKLNGNPSKLLLDTGASGIVINSKLAERAGLRHAAETKLSGFGDEGAGTGYVAYVDSIQVGGLEFKGCIIEVLDRKRSLGEDGFIGADVFQDFLVDINFPDQKLLLSELPKAPDAGEQSLGLQSEESGHLRLHDRYIAPEMLSYERFYRFGHFILVPTLVNTTANSRLFLMDTGSEDTMLAADFARQVTKVHHDDFTTVRGVSGKVKNVYLADGVNIGFPASRLMKRVDNVTALDLSDMSDSAGTEVSGVLGFTLLWLLDIKIDYRDGLVQFSFDPHRLH